MEELPVLGVDPEDLAERLIRLARPDLALGQIAAQWRGREQGMDLVPFDLEGRQQGQEVVDIGAAGDVAGHGALAVEETAAPARRSRHGLPGLHISETPLH